MSDQHLTPEERQRRNLIRLARNPATPANWLGTVPWGTRHGDRALRNALAANPSTPPHVLATLVQWAPDAFARNPGIPLLMLENPSFLLPVPPEGLAAALRNAVMPRVLVAGIAAGTQSKHPMLREAAQLHVAMASELPDSEWRERIRAYWHQAASGSLNDEQRHLLCELVELDLVPAAFKRYADPDPLPPDDFETVRRENPSWVETGRKKPPDWVPKRWITGHELHLLRGGAFNPSVPGETLLGWIERDFWVDRAIAAHPNTTPETLAVLSRHMDASIRRRVLRNPNLTPALLEECRQRALKRLLHASLTFSPGLPSLLGRFAAMQQAPVPVYRPRLQRMAESCNWQDRMAAALAIGPRPNGQPPRPRHHQLLERLAEDGIVLVRAAARARLREESFSWPKE